MTPFPVGGEAVKDFLIRSTEDLYVVRGTDRYHVYHGGKATFVLAETLENYP